METNNDISIGRKSHDGSDNNTININFTLSDIECLAESYSFDAADSGEQILVFEWESNGVRVKISVGEDND